MKPNLQFISSYSLSLYHFVEKLTIWEPNVSHQFQDYLNERYELSTEDEAILEKLKQQRNKLGWDYEVLLHEWAEQEFPDNEQFTDIYTAVRWFENKTDKSGESFAEKIAKFQPLLNEKTRMLEQMWNDLEIQDEFTKMQALLEFTYPGSSIPAFIVPSPDPDSLQGGANGEGITVEVYPDAEDLDNSFSLIVHEFAHKAIDPSHYFENLEDHALREFFQQKDDKISLNNYADHIEELIIRSFIDVRHFGAEPIKMADNYRDRESMRTDMYALSWEHVEFIFPEINNYLEGRYSIEETREKLITTFQEKISKAS